MRCNPFFPLAVPLKKPGRFGDWQFPVGSRVLHSGHGRGCWPGEEVTKGPGSCVTSCNFLINPQSIPLQGSCILSDFTPLFNPLLSPTPIARLSLPCVAFIVLPGLNAVIFLIIHLGSLFETQHSKRSVYSSNLFSSIFPFFAAFHFSMF